ncbi:hypothetical protein DL98DRAFT_588844 [Cadophora sp. DSE1049]|nr:hypothetical protein DL98DRAFT_588844 [Cadophora sp. DSE1049]
MDHLPVSPSLNESFGQKVSSWFKQPVTKRHSRDRKRNTQSQDQDQGQFEDSEPDTASHLPIFGFGSKFAKPDQGAIQRKRRYSAIAGRYAMGADENTIPQLPAELPVDARDLGKTEDESSHGNHPANRRLTLPAAATEVTSDNRGAEPSGADIEPPEAWRPIRRITNPEPNQVEQLLWEDPATKIQDTGEDKNADKGKRRAESGEGPATDGMSISSKESLQREKDKDVHTTIEEDLNKSTVEEPPCCQWCPDPTRSKLPAEVETEFFNVVVAVQELIDDEDETAETNRREQALIGSRAHQHRQELNERSGGEPSNFQDDETADSIPYWGYQYPDPPPIREAGSVQIEVATQLPTSARRGVTFGNTPSPRRSREADRANSGTAPNSSVPTSTEASENPPAYRVGNWEYKEVSKHLISKDAREKTKHGMRRLSVGELERGDEPTTASGLPIMGIEADKVVMSIPKRRSIISQEVMPEEVVESSELENDEGTRQEALENVDGMDTIEPREEQAENTLHVEHEEDIGNADGRENLGNEEICFVGKFKRFFRFDTWKKPRKEKED